MRKSEMEQRTRAFVGYLVFLQLVQLCFACQMEGITNWLLRVEQSVLDTKIGTFFDRSTSNIEGIANIVYGEGINRGPYIDVSYANSRFTVSTTERFAEYEEYETSRTMRVTVTFNCSPGSSPLIRPLVLQIDIIDTNNNAPRLLPSNSFEFTVTPPLPPGFLVTGCENQIIARDIDLTTQRVDFTIDDNPYFEIFYEKSTAVKEFSATFRAKTFIRSISEPLSFTIKATDVDETGDPPLTSTATVRILADTQFQLPDELQFSRAFYTINYNAEHNLITNEAIILTRGYDSLVKFSIEGQHSNNFEIRTAGNQIIFEVKSPLTSDIFQENQIYIVLRAEREYTSGTSATIIIQLPPARELSFDSPSYTGIIENNALEYIPIILNKGYEKDVVFTVRGDQADLFNVRNEENRLLLSLKSKIPEDFLRTNNIMVLEVAASGQNTNEASATVIFEIMKEDVNTPVFSKQIYQGVYINPSYIDIEDITLVQGYDETVSLQLFGEHANYFAINIDGGSIAVSLKSIIPENIIFSAKVFILYIVATKPNTVGGNTALVIRFSNDLTEPSILRFSKNTYTGSLKENTVSMENIILEVGYTEQIRFILSGDHSDYFTLSNNGNSVSITPDDELFNQNFKDKSFLLLNVLAERENAIPVTSTIVINIVNKVIVQPVFNKAYYRGVYSEKGLQFNEDITLAMGFDETVSFQLEGEFSQWFYITQNRNSVTLNKNTTNMIPDEIMDNNKIILFTIIANKPDTPSQSAVIAIELVKAKEENSLDFDRPYYTGSLDNNTVILEPITLLGNYDIAHLITIHGHMAEYFDISQKEAIVEIILQRALPENIINNNRIITLEIRSTVQDTIKSRATIVLEITRPENDPSVIDSIRFNQAYYTGRYTSQNILYFDEVISLAEGYDDTVQFELEGEFSQWFYIIQHENSVTLHKNAINILPDEIKEEYNQILFTIVAHKPKAVPREAVIAIEFTRDDVDNQLDFDRPYYTGSLDNNIVILEPITLLGNYDIAHLITIHGHMAEYFDISQKEAIVEIILQRALPENIINNNRIITFEIRATVQDTIKSRATIVLEITRPENDPSVIDSIRFNQAYYTGRYTSQNILYFDEVISLAEGYDDTVQFELEGEFSQWFYIIQHENSVTLHKNAINILPDEIKEEYNQILFTIVAHKPKAVPREAVIAIELTRDDVDNQLDFDRPYYTGSLDNNIVILEPITLLGNYDIAHLITIHGDMAEYFDISQKEAIVEIILQRALPENIINNNRIITFEIRATVQDTIKSRATIVLEITRPENDPSVIDSIRFNQAYYTGRYTSQNILYFDEVISLAEGYDDTIQFELEGEFSQWFYIIQHENSVTLHKNAINMLPDEIKEEYNQILFTIVAHKPKAVPREAVIAIELTRDDVDNQLDFDRVYYVGSLNRNIITLDPIMLMGNYDETYTIRLHGEFSDYFSISQQGSIIKLLLQQYLPEDYISNNEILTFEIRATKQNIRIASATIVLRFIKQGDDVESLNTIRFGRAYYTGRYSSVNDFSFDQTISLIEGYDESVLFALEGEYTPWFQLQQHENSATLILSEPISSAIVNSRPQLIFVVRADRLSDETVTRSTIVIIFEKEDNTIVLKFERQNYIGTIKDNKLNLESIVLIEGYNDMVSFSLHGELNSYFSLSVEKNVISIGLQRSIPEDIIPDNGIITIDVKATVSHALPVYTTVVLKVAKTNVMPEQDFNFDKPYYYGSYMENAGLIFDTTIRLIEGYDESIKFTLDGEDSTWFEIRQFGSSATLLLSKSIPENILNMNTQLIFVVQAQKSDQDVILTRSVIIIELLNDSSPEPGATFDKVLYRGRLENGVVVHETITVLEHDGDVQLSGEYEKLFRASVSNGVVSVEATSTVLPTTITYMVLKLKAAEANAVLLLDITQSDTPVDPPSLSFSSPSYVLQADETFIGLVGRVSASADNGEAVTYSLGIENEHLRQRVTVNNGGEIHLSAAADVGSYNFQVSAITIISRVSASATVQLTVIEAESENTITLPPLIILERDEEEPHRNLVPLSTSYPNCQYRLINRWPEEQNWLYVDQEGLHARSIDREHESIAFMPVSQVQVELNLYCDDQVRANRWIRSATQEIGFKSYDYGSNRWILSDSVLYDPKRTLVNLIVNDINDNAPIFIGKDNEPLTVGYPREDIEEMVLPRALAELKATDADIGENAELRYWSSEEGISVSPTTGSVHVRNHSVLEDNSRLIINAADRNGTGLSGSLEILVRLLDRNQIAVITVKNVFLEDELKILNDLTQAMGYEIKTLRTTVVSESIDENSEERSRTRRDLNTLGASLQLYVYGLRQREPIDVSQLTADLSNNNIVTVSLARVLSLEDHLEGLQICTVPGREIGLLAATIVFAVLLFVVTVTIAIWLYLKRKNAPNYDQFSDQNSLRSRNESIESPKAEAVFTTSKLNIDELRKSEKRLQEMLDAPNENVNDPKEEPVLPKNTQETVVELSEPESKWPIVIQSIDKLKDNAEESDDNDEFGEKQQSRRKSVVTFNENVEKIIHLEDGLDEESELDVEVHKL